MAVAKELPRHARLVRLSRRRQIVKKPKWLRWPWRLRRLHPGRYTHCRRCDEAPQRSRAREVHRGAGRIDKGNAIMPREPKPQTHPSVIDPDNIPETFATGPLKPALLQYSRSLTPGMISA